ncbi:MAG: asparagine synthase-related protein, partial [Dehalococcoidia bacterium]
LVITQSGHRQARYWSYDEPPSQPVGQPAEQLRHLLADAVRLRLRADVPMGILLSGGLDSTAIAVLAAKEAAGHGLRAYAAVFPGFWADEERHARRAATHAGMPPPSRAL